MSGWWHKIVWDYWRGTEKKSKSKHELSQSTAGPLLFFFFSGFNVKYAPPPNLSGCNTDEELEHSSQRNSLQLGKDESRIKWNGSGVRVEDLINPLAMQEPISFRSGWGSLCLYDASV